MNESLRLNFIDIVDTNNINAAFTLELSTNLDVSNVSIISETPNTPDPVVLTVVVNDNILEINCTPLTELSAYTIIFKSTEIVPFTSLNGDELLVQDGIGNQKLFLGPLLPENPIRTYFESYYRDNIYTALSDRSSLVSKIVDGFSIVLAKALYDIRQVKNENYLTVDVIDERKVRGEGPFDRLSEEGAYHIDRVGLTKTNTVVSKTFAYDVFPYFPVSLQQLNFSESLVIDSENGLGKFNVNDLILNFNNSPVIKLNRLIFSYTLGHAPYVYDIEVYGYQIKENRYDKDFAFTYLLLEDNQIKLSDKILNDPDFSLENVFSIVAEYSFKNEGIYVNESSIEVFNPTLVIREVLPPIENIFSLKHGPIVDVNGNIVSKNGVIFVDPNNFTSAPHPAFKYEIPYIGNALPARPGEYSIDYSNGTVYVFGEDLNHTGTGPMPPLASYRYKLTYQNEVDYSYDPLTYELVSLPKGNLRDNYGKIKFDYEQVLVPNVDYVEKIHKEELSERIENRLVALNCLRVKNSPITNAFRIYNESSGEIYNITRWNNDLIYYTFTNPPRIEDEVFERVSFKSAANEILFVSDILLNSNSDSVFKILLNNSEIGALTEDGIGSSINTSVIFSNNNIFTFEKWFDKNETIQQNINKLSVGEYTIDYLNGVIYCAVSDENNLEIGNINYKLSTVNPVHPHLISVDDIYYQINLNIKNKIFSYQNFGEGFININGLENSDEAYLNNNTQLPYQIVNNEIGVIEDAIFVSGVSNSIKTIRGVYQFDDLKNNNYPLNFVESSSFDDNVITTNVINKSLYQSIGFDGTNFFVLLDFNSSYISPDISFTFSVKKLSDDSELWDGSGTIVPGAPLKLVLSGVNSPVDGESVVINYSYEIVDLSRVVVDYNKGDLFIDYAYLADEIIVSYEYGDNVLDFRKNTIMDPGTEYFVSYKVGALRDALVRNFATLLNISELNNFEIDFPRERYRDVVTAALHSFGQGPTVKAIETIGKKISHITPEVIESLFLGWSLGSSLLNPQYITADGAFELGNGKYDKGVIIDSNDKSLSFPVSSNLKLEQGTFEAWISPFWNGLDNDAELEFTILKNNLPISNLLVFIGGSEYHPESNVFKLTKDSDVSGTPNLNKNGIFIYFDKDVSGKYDRWYFYVKDGYDGYSSGGYSIKIKSNGKFYDTKTINNPAGLFTGSNLLTYNIQAGIIDQGLTFISDKEHYILDVGDDKKGRISLYKDVSGYLNFRVIDKNNKIYNLSNDVSDWKVNEFHHVAITWKLNTFQDEMHLFVDGFEVPNITKFGSKVATQIHEKFRTINPEEIVGATTYDIVGSNDMIITAGSSLVSSSINFSDYIIAPGDTLYINENGFNPAGYTILSVSGNNLTLSSTLPFSLTNVKFSVNKTTLSVQTNVDLYTRVTVAKISPIVLGIDLTTTLDSNIVSVSNLPSTVEVGDLLRILNVNENFIITAISGTTLTLDEVVNQTLINAAYTIYNNEEVELAGVKAVRPDYQINDNEIVISNGINANDLILIKNYGLNFKSVKQKVYIWSSDIENIIKTKLPAPISLNDVTITKIVLPATLINSSNSTITGNDLVSNNIITDQPSGSTNGRTLSITISGNNIDFSNPVNVFIDGYNSGGSVLENIVFSENQTVDTVNLYTGVNYIVVDGTLLNPSKNLLTLEIKEKNSLTVSEDNTYSANINYIYPVQTGMTLYSIADDFVQDDNQWFSNDLIGNLLYISYPPSSVGFYNITEVSSDFKSFKLSSTATSSSMPLSFTDGYYTIYNNKEYRSGFQNGFFILENSEDHTPYTLSKGFYEISYTSHLNIRLDLGNGQGIIGNNLALDSNLNGILDELKVSSRFLTDTRVGELSLLGERSITKDFNSLKPLRSDNGTLMLYHFDEYPFVNDVDYYVRYLDKQYHQVANKVNAWFNDSILINDNPIVIPNEGIMNKNEGTIELWINPLNDTANDPNNRFYFDASSTIDEVVVSEDYTTVKVSGKIGQVLSVKLTTNDQIDYFAGGDVEISTDNAITESEMSVNKYTITVNNPILQLVSIKVVGDLTDENYVDGSRVVDKTIYLAKELPSVNTNVIVIYKPTNVFDNTLNSQVIKLNKKLPSKNIEVVVNYIPAGTNGDRIALFKDKLGYLNFLITADKKDYLVQAPIFWSKNTWHKVRAQYKANSTSDSIRLFIDGYEYGNLLFGAGLVFGTPAIFGMTTIGEGSLKMNIKLKDPINELFIGSDFRKNNLAYSLIDNLRISNVFRPVQKPFGESLDTNFNKNLEMVIPMTEDLYTTLILDFDTILVKNEDFATIKNKNNGNFDFYLNVFDSFGIIESSGKSKELLEIIVKRLKPANSRAFISYSK